VAVVVIPARGGSKGIPRKNLRPLAGKPLIYYAIRAAREAACAEAVIVDTDDREIALFAERFGARVQMRPEPLAGDAVPLDPVIAHAVEAYGRDSGSAVEVVVTVQPTSPLVRAEDVEGAVALLAESGADTVLSVVSDRHLTWRRTEAGFRPNYAERVNRQFLPDDYRETGAVVACRAALLRERGTRIGDRTELLVMPRDRAVDIDSYQDWAVAEFLLRRRRVAFVVAGSAELGLGHAYRALMLAHEFTDHEVRFLCPAGNELAAELIARSNYPVEMVAFDKLVPRLAEDPPALVINDVLDTSADYVVALRRLGCRVVNFEDLGPGAEVADRVYNALYPHRLPLTHVRVGPDYFCLRDEFIHAPEGLPEGPVRRVLVTFGGTDEGNLTAKVVEAIAPLCRERDLLIDVITGPGYAFRDDLKARAERLWQAGNRIEVTHEPGGMSAHMAAAQVAFSAAGRTVFELASLGVPTVVLCQNEREITHTFARPENGLVNLGLGREVAADDLTGALRRIVDDDALRRAMAERMGRFEFRAGKARVVGEIKALLAEPAPEGTEA
jgi:CMP-N-acetylneuraminic acid synthetase/spore coat polysaccharide biosynthesis predicted glycosyltransferase SpsG